MQEESLPTGTIISGDELERERQLRNKYGIDKEQPTVLHDTQRIQRLYDVASLRREDKYDDETERAKELAFDDLYQSVLSTEGSIFQMFDSVRYASSQSLRDLEVLERLYREVRNKFVHLSHTTGLANEEVAIGHGTARALNEFVAVSSGILENTGFLDDCNYLFARRLQDFAYRIGITETAEHEFEYIPFEISRGIYAALAPPSLRRTVSARIKNSLLTAHCPARGRGWSQIAYCSAANFAWPINTFLQLPKIPSS